MFEGVSLPFSVQELLSSAMDLFDLVGEYLLLALSIPFVWFFLNLMGEIFDAYKIQRENPYYTWRSDRKRSRAQSLGSAWEIVKEQRGWYK